MKCYVLVGKSSSGKDTIYNKLVRKLPYLKQVTTHTSRPKRVGESEDSYHFISNIEFYNMARNKEFVEFRTYNVVQGVWRYGLSKAELEQGKSHLLILDLGGLEKLEKYVGKENITSFFIDATAQTRLLRSLNREGDMSDSQVNEVVRRFMADKEDMDGLKVQYACDYNLNNNSMDDLYKSIEFIINHIKNDR